MSTAVPHPDLSAALALSRDIVAVADHGDMTELAQLDGKRLELLQSFRRAAREIPAADRAVLKEIADLNERALGLMEHRRRIQGRALDMAAVGRRAVTAYANNRARL